VRALAHVRLHSHSPWAVPCLSWNNQRGSMTRGVCAVAVGALVLAGSVAEARGYEIWLVDQSNSFGKTYGGRVLIYDGKKIARGGDDDGDDPAPSNDPEAVIDLGGATADLSSPAPVRTRFGPTWWCSIPPRRTAASPSSPLDTWPSSTPAPVSRWRVSVCRQAPPGCAKPTPRGRPTTTGTFSSRIRTESSSSASQRTTPPTPSRTNPPPR
jgi:hypothetical protein